MLTLYDYLSSGNGYKCRLLLAQLGIAYRRVELDIIEAPDVQAALSGLVRAQARQHRLMPVCELADEVDDQMLTAR